MRKDRSFAIINPPKKRRSGSCPHVLSTEAVQIPEAREKHSWVAYVERTGWNEKSFGKIDSTRIKWHQRHWISHANSVGNGNFPRKRTFQWVDLWWLQVFFVCLQVPVSTEDLFATRPRTKKASLILRFESAEIGIWHSNWRQILANLASYLGRQDWMKKARTSKSSKGHGWSWRWKTMNTSKLWKTLWTFNSSLGVPAKTKPRAKAAVRLVQSSGNGSIFSHFIPHWVGLGSPWISPCPWWLSFLISKIHFICHLICRFLRCHRWMSYTQLWYSQGDGK